MQSNLPSTTLMTRNF